MKIITRFESVWNGARYVTGAEEAFDYAGPIARCDLGGGSSTTTIVQPATPPPPTKEETRANELTLAQLERQNTLMEQYFPVQQQQADLSKAALEDLRTQQASDRSRQAAMDALYSPEQQATDAVAEFKQRQELNNLSNTVLQAQLKQIQEGGKPTPEQIASIDEAVSAEKTTANIDIDRYMDEALKKINEEVAVASGLRPTDTPIMRQSEAVGAEGLRQKGQISSRLAQTAATARLNIPAAQIQLGSNIASNAQQITQAAESFKAQLDQQARENRTRLFQQPGLSSLNFGGSAQGYASSMAGARMGLAGRMTNADTSNDLGLADVGKAASGLGMLIGGAAGFFAGGPAGAAAGASLGSGLKL